MKKSAILMFLVAFTVVVALTPSSKAVGIITDLSAPIQYDANTWYAYASLSGDPTWDVANTLVSALPAYNGLAAGLATFTDAQYTWFQTKEYNFTSPYIGDWDIAWIGASNAGGGSYTWLNGQAIPSSSPHWASGHPIANNYGVSWQMRSYGDVWETRGVSGTLGNAIIQYSAVPEPATLGLLALGGVAMIRRRLAA